MTRCLHIYNCFDAFLYPLSSAIESPAVHFRAWFWQFIECIGGPVKSVWRSLPDSHEMKIEVSGRESKLQALVYSLSPTTAIVGYAISLRKLSASLPEKDPPFPWKQAEKNFALFKIWSSLSTSPGTYPSHCQVVSEIPWDDDDDVELHVLGCRLTY